MSVLRVSKTFSGVRKVVRATLPFHEVLARFRAQVGNASIPDIIRLTADTPDEQATIGRHDTEPDAIDCVRQLLRANPNSEPEILDTQTGKPVAPAASRGWREHLSKQVGY